MKSSLSYNYLRGIAEYLSQRALNSDDFFEKFEITLAELDDSGKRLPIEQYQQMLADAATYANDKDAGLHIGECIKPGNYGVLGYAVMSCKTAEEAFDRHMRYEALVSDRAVSTYSKKGSHVHLVWDTKGENTSQFMEDENVASWVTFARWISGQFYKKPEKICFTYPQPKDLREYERIFGCELLFEQDNVEVVFDESILHMPITQHDPIMKEMMDAYAEKLLAEFSQGEDFLTEVGKVLSIELPKGTVSLERVAEEMDMSPRTLQRRLGEYDMSFQKLLDNTRKELALTYISQPFIELAELAYLLGFSDQTAFQRAFKKWTGMTPGKYRKEK